MSELIRCDICGDLIDKEDAFSWHSVTIRSKENYGYLELPFHTCDACKKDLEKMLHNAERR